MPDFVCSLVSLSGSVNIYMIYIIQYYLLYKVEASGSKLSDAFSQAASLDAVTTIKYHSTTFQSSI